LKNYNVHGTVRSLKDETKIKHLHEITHSSGNKGKLQLFEADLLKDGSFEECFRGCDAVFHTASPFQHNVADPVKDLLEPAVHGTENVIREAIKEKSIKKVILTSSMAAVCGQRPDGHVYLEKDFNDTATIEKSPYPFSKVKAELSAWKLIDTAKADGRDIELITINPGFVLGAVLSDRVDATSVKFVMNLMNGTTKEVSNAAKFANIDVMDVVKAHIKAYESPNAKGRYICTHSESVTQADLAKLVAKNFPEYPVITKTIDDPVAKGRYDNSKLIDLIGELTPIETSIIEMGKSLIAYGIVKPHKSK